ncbi:MAG: hypothetical protein K940chlam2_01336, partial [Chlamydiae bacterium]|nr:hypothetical protein [Chlamydiota bacterium]
MRPFRLTLFIVLAHLLALILINKNPAQKKQTLSPQKVAVQTITLIPKPPPPAPKPETQKPQPPKPAATPPKPAATPPKPIATPAKPIAKNPQIQNSTMPIPAFIF